MKKIRRFFDKLLAHKSAKCACDIVLIAVGTFCMGIAYSVFLTSHNITPSGFSGLSNLISELILTTTGFLLYPAIIYLVLNIGLFLFAFRNLGVKFCIYAALGIAFYSLFMQYGNLSIFVTNDLLLSAIIGGVVMGIGMGLVIRIGASTGGCDMLASIVTRLIPTISAGTIIFIVDFAVIFASIFVYGLANSLYALIAIYISTKTTDLIIDGVKSVRAYYIISDRKEEIRKELLEKLKRGITEIQAKGAYEGASKNMIMCLIRRGETHKLKEIIKAIDPNCFMFCTSVSEALGKGFYTKPEKTSIKKIVSTLKNRKNNKAKQTNTSSEQKSGTENNKLPELLQPEINEEIVALSEDETK